MPALELHHVDGNVESRELSRTQPLTVGRQPFNDICVPDEDVGAMHCRILWNKASFEVTAATPGGVEVNGTTVSHARLNPGDLIRIGSLDLIFVDQAAVDEESGELRLRDPEVEFGDARGHSTIPPRPDHSPKSIPAENKPAAKKDRGRLQEPIPEFDPAASMFEGPVYTESQVMAAYDVLSAVGEEDISHVKLKPLGSSPATEPKRAAAPLPPLISRIASASRARPGEQEIFRSPLVLGLSIGGLVLVLVTGIFWFLIGREQSTRLYDRAVAELNEGQYAQSIASFEQFLQQYSGHPKHRLAERGLGKALVQKEIAGATPAWKKGLEQIHAMISRHRNESDFAELNPVLHRYGEEIALGSARTAESTRDADLLTVSEDAQVVMERYADPASPPTAAIGRIKDARIAAVLAIGKQKMFDDAMAAVEAALAAKQPMAALSEREKLVRAYDGFAGHKRVKEALQKAMEVERAVIVTDDGERAAETTESANVVSALGLFHTRTRTDESSLGRVAYVMAKDCCYAVDTVTGDLVWRRITGFEVPFFPMTVSGTQPGVLLYDSYRQALLCCQPTTGKLIWKQKLDGRPRSAPLVHEGQIYLPTDNRSMCRIDAETGRLNERVTFSQNVQGPPTLSADGNHLLIPGEMAMIYAMSMRPLAPAAMTFTDHAAGSIAAPPLALGKLFLLCENDRADSARLRLWDASLPKASLVELTAKELRIRGQVREAPVLRGNQLMVPSSGEHLAAFSVTDAAGREGLAPVAQYAVGEIKDNPKAAPGAEQEATADEVAVQPVPVSTRVPLYLALGADGQFWAAGSAFRRFELGADSIHSNSNAIAPGIASQRLQLIGDQFFVGRKGLFHDAVVFSSVDRDRMVSPWRIVLGTQFPEVIPSGDGGAVAVSEAGQIVMLSQERLRQGGFDLKSATELPLPSRISRKLITSSLHDGRIFLAAAGDLTSILIIGRTGQVEFSTKLKNGESVQIAGVMLDGGLLLPMPGRLKLVQTSAGKKAVQDWLAPAGDKPILPWTFLLRLEDDEVLACGSGGLLQRIQVRATDVPHLAEAAKLQLDQPVDTAPAVRGEQMLLATAAGSVQLHNWRTFDRDGKRDFSATIRGTWSVGSAWLVWSDDGKLHALAEGRDLPIRWSFDLKGLEPAGAPLEENGRLWIACRDGSVVAVDANGAESRRIRLPQSLTMGLKTLNDGFYAVACDGALYRVDSMDGQ